jgi:hypothetical protein
MHLYAVCKEQIVKNVLIFLVNKYCQKLKIKESKINQKEAITKEQGDVTPRL